MNLKHFEALCKKRFLDISKAFDKECQTKYAKGLFSNYN